MQEYLPLLSIIILLVTVFIFIRAPFLKAFLSIPYSLLIRALRYFHILRPDTHWSVVYDAKTKVPIDPAYITVKNTLGVEVANMITDINGRFALLLPRGLYTIEAQKTHYQFPAESLNPAKTDGKYVGLYYGETLQVVDDERSVAIAIPMDPIGTDWNQEEKKKQHVFFHFQNEMNYKGAEIFYTIIGSGLTLALYKHTPNYFYCTLLWVYAVVAVVIFLVWMFERTHYSHSVVLDKKTKQPLAFARVTIFTVSHHMQVMRKITSFEGQFTALLPPARYYVTIEIRDEHGKYSLTYTSASFRVRDGYIGKEFNV
jgi:hypothetical protein